MDTNIFMFTLISETHFNFLHQFHFFLLLFNNNIGLLYHLLHFLHFSLLGDASVHQGEILLKRPLNLYWAHPWRPAITSWGLIFQGQIQDASEYHKQSLGPWIEMRDNEFLPFECLHRRILLRYPSVPYSRCYCRSHQRIQQTSHTAWKKWVEAKGDNISHLVLCDAKFFGNGRIWEHLREQIRKFIRRSCTVAGHYCM